jgi:tRNA(adenine34) deaminase
MQDLRDSGIAVLAPKKNKISASDVFFLNEALAEAEKAGRFGEVPVGAVIVRNGEVIVRTHNLKEANRNVTAHAELLAIDEACTLLGDWRLTDCELFTTLEPCPMCAGAILHARLKRVVFGAKDIKWGAAGSVVHLFDKPYFNHRTEAVHAANERCAKILSQFFRELR